MNTFSLKYNNGQYERYWYQVGIGNHILFSKSIWYDTETSRGLMAVDLRPVIQILPDDLNYSNIKNIFETIYNIKDIEVIFDYEHNLPYDNTNQIIGIK